MVHPSDRKDAESDIQTRIVNPGRRHGDLHFRLITKNGDVRYAEVFIHLLHAEDGRAYLHGFLCDVSKEAYLNLRNLSRTERVFRSQETYRDALSGLPNRSAFFAYAREISAANRDFENITVAVFDIVGLRRVNFHMSREEGDRRILSLIEIIQNHMPEKALVFRGHEAEIMVLFESMSEAEVLPYIQKVIDACNGTVAFGVSSAGIHE
jgi:GGDEF domain-containing protein